MSSQRRSVNRPFPSSPHWVPTITVPGTTAPSAEPLFSRSGSLLTSPEEPLVQRHRHDLAARGAHLLAGQTLDDGDGDRTGLDQAGVEQVARQHPTQPVPELLEVDDDLVLGIVEEVG